jgi:hypothetical protein
MMALEETKILICWRGEFEWRKSRIRIWQSPTIQHVTPFSQELEAVNVLQSWGYFKISQDNIHLSRGRTQIALHVGILFDHEHLYPI